MERSLWGSGQGSPVEGVSSLCNTLFITIIQYLCHLDFNWSIRFGDVLRTNCTKRNTCLSSNNHSSQNHFTLREKQLVDCNNAHFLHSIEGEFLFVSLLIHKFSSQECKDNLSSSKLLNIAPLQVNNTITMFTKELNFDCFSTDNQELNSILRAQSGECTCYPTSTVGI